MEVLYGLHPVEEAVRSGARRLDCVMLARERKDERLERLAEACRAAGLRVSLESRDHLTRMARTDAHQGVLALTRAIAPVELDDLVAGGGATPFLLVAAGITDPRNLGALLRSAECAGVTGVVLPRHRSARLSPTVAKVAAGAIEHLAFSTVPGIPVGLERLGALGVMTVGLAGDAPRSLYDLDVADSPVALVLGEEERGLAPLVRKRCDTLVSIPQLGQVESLNVSVAGAVALFEVARQRARSR